MHFCKKFYVGESIKHPRKVKKQLQKQGWMRGIFLIAETESDGQLEIINSLLLAQSAYREIAYDPCVVGIAAGRKEAMALICRITQDVVTQTGCADLRSYFGLTPAESSQV